MWWNDRTNFEWKYIQSYSSEVPYPFEVSRWKLCDNNTNFMHKFSFKNWCITQGSFLWQINGLYNRQGAKWEFFKGHTLSSFEFSPMVFSSNFVSAVFIAINEVIGANILLSYRNFPCWKLNWKTRTINKGLVKSQEILIFVFEAINDVKRQKTSCH